MTIETNGAARETIEIGRGELPPAVRAKHVTIEAIEQYYDCVFRFFSPPRRDFVSTHQDESLGEGKAVR